MTLSFRIFFCTLALIALSACHSTQSSSADDDPKPVENTADDADPANQDDPFEQVETEVEEPAKVETDPRPRFDPLDPGAKGELRSLLIRPSILLDADAAEGELAPGPETWGAISFDDAAYDLLQYDVIFVGELHGTRACHAFQLRLFEALSARRPTMALSMEQFERDTQPVVDRYVQQWITEDQFRQKIKTMGQELWGNYDQDYRPLIEVARNREIPVIASNIPRRLASRVYKESPSVIEEFSKQERRWTAETLMLDTPEYRAKFYAAMGAMMSAGSHKKEAEESGDAEGGKDSDGNADAAEDSAASDGASGSDSAEEAPTPEELAAQEAERKAARERMMANLFAAQAIKDDTMAESIANYLSLNPGHLVMHTCGAFHSDAHLGTVERLRRRMPDLKIAVISPLRQTDPLAPVITGRDLAQGEYVLVVPYQPENAPKASE